MSHLLAVRFLSRWPIFRQELVFVCVCIPVMYCKYVTILFPFCTGAVHRFYETRRRIFNDNKPTRKEHAQKAKVKARKKELRKRVWYDSNVINKCLPNHHTFPTVWTKPCQCTAIHYPEEVLEEFSRRASLERYQLGAHVGREWSRWYDNQQAPPSFSIWR